MGVGSILVTSFQLSIYLFKDPISKHSNSETLEARYQYINFWRNTIQFINNSRGQPNSIPAIAKLFQL